MAERPRQRAPSGVCSTMLGRGPQRQRNGGALLRRLSSKHGGARREAAGAAPRAPRKGPYWSLMLEVSESVHKPVAHAPAWACPGTGRSFSKVVLDTVVGCLNVGLLQPGDEIVSLHFRRMDHGPVSLLLHCFVVHWRCDRVFFGLPPAMWQRSLIFFLAFPFPMPFPGTRRRRSGATAC